MQSPKSDQRGAPPAGTVSPAGFPGQEAARLPSRMGMDRRRTRVDGERTRPLRVGACIPLVEGEMDGAMARGADVLAMARAAERVGFDSVWIPDHLLIHDAPRPPQGTWECASMLGALCVATSRVAIGALVIATSFRNPTLVAKMA